MVLVPGCLVTLWLGPVAMMAKSDATGLNLTGELIGISFYLQSSFTTAHDMRTVSYTGYRLLQSFVIAVSGSKDLEDRLAKVLPFHQQTRKDNSLLYVDFITLFQYLFYLRELSLMLHPLGPQAVFYLAAAVADFYIPQSLMVTSWFKVCVCISVFHFVV